MSGRNDTIERWVEDPHGGLPQIGNLQVNGRWNGDDCDVLDALLEDTSDGLNALQRELAVAHLEESVLAAQTRETIDRALAQIRALDEGAVPRNALEWECRLEVLKMRHEWAIRWSILKGDRLVEARAEEDRLLALGEWWSEGRSEWARAMHGIASDELRQVRSQVAEATEALAEVSS